MRAERLAVGVETSCKYPLRLELWKMRLCKAFGVDSLFIPDHLSTVTPSAAWGADATPAARAIPREAAFFEPFVMLGMMSARFRRVRLGTGVTEPFRHHPATLAQAFVTLDHLTGGRAILGIGAGERENIKPYGIPFTARTKRLEETLCIIRELWESRGEPIDFSGDLWKLRQARFETPLFDGRAPTIWVGAHGPRALAIAGRYGDGWYPTLKMSAQDYRNKLATVVHAGIESGRSMERFEASGQIFVMLGSSRQAVLDQAAQTPAIAGLLLSAPPEVWSRHGLRHPLEATYRGFGTTLAREVTQGHLEQASAGAHPELVGEIVFAGAVSEVVEEVRSLAAAGMRHVVIANFSPMVRGFRLDDLLRLWLLIRRLRRIEVGAH